MGSVITNATVRSLKPRSRPYEVTCARLAGFAVRVLPSGKKVFVVRHRLGGRDKRERIGPWGPELEADEARRQAMAILAGQGNSAPNTIARGATAGRGIARPESAGPAKPARSRRSEMRAAEQVEADSSHLLVSDMAERFIKEHVEVYLKPSTQAAYKRMLKRYILPEFGHRRFDEVTRREVKAFHTRLYDASSTAEYVLSVIGSLYTRIIDDWELCEMRNPTAGIKRRPSRRIDRFLSPEERRAVVTAIDTAVKLPRGRKGHIEQASAWALMLLMLTGQRRNEILTLTWEMVDWQHRCIHFPDTKTGQRSTPVSSQAIALLREIHDATGNRRSGLVIRGRCGRKLSRINDTWNSIRTTAGCPDVRLHDLRHSFASDALMAGVPLAIVGEMLGHKQPNTTKRYAHLADRVVREALETTGLRISQAHREPEPVTYEESFVPVSDAEWARIAPRIQAGKQRGGKPVDLRGIVNGIRWVQQRKAKWADVPACYGSPTTCWRWFKRWSDAGVWLSIIDR